MKFKLTNKSRVLLAAGVFLIALISLSMVQMQQIQARSRAEKEIAQTSLLIEKLTDNGLKVQKEDLQGQIETAKINVAQVKDSLRQSLETIESSGDIYDIAARSYVNIVRIDSSAVSEKEIGGVKCTVLAVTVRAEGSAADLINFVSRLTAKYHTGAVTSVRLNVTEEPAVGDNATGSEAAELPQILVDLTIYDYRGD